MSRPRPLAWALALALSCVLPPCLAGAETPRAEAVIIRVDGPLAYIDAGQQQGLMEGDLLDIMSTEILTHPLTGDTLSVTPTAVGALRVRQVFPRFAIGELIHVEPGQDPMLMPVYRIMDPERMSQVMLYAQRFAYAVAGSGVSRRRALVPGLYQLKLGSPAKGWALLGLEAAALTAGVLSHVQSANYYDNYKGLGTGHTTQQFDYQFERANTWHNRSKTAYWIAGAVIAYNWIDVLWLGKAPAVESGLELSHQGTPLLQLAYGF